MAEPKYRVTIRQNEFNGHWEATLFENGNDVGSAADESLVEVVRHLHHFAASERLTVGYATDLQLVLNHKP